MEASIKETSNWKNRGSLYFFSLSPKVRSQLSPQVWHMSRVLIMPLMLVWRQRLMNCIVYHWNPHLYRQRFCMNERRHSKFIKCNTTMSFILQTGRPVFLKFDKSVKEKISLTFGSREIFHFKRRPFEKNTPLISYSFQLDFVSKLSRLGIKNSTKHSYLFVCLTITKVVCSF